MLKLLLITFKNFSKITTLEEQVKRLTELSLFSSGTCIKTLSNISEDYPNSLLEFGDFIIVGDTKGKLHFLQEFVHMKELEVDAHQADVNDLIKLKEDSFASCSDDHSIILWKLEGNYPKLQKKIIEKE